MTARSKTRRITRSIAVAVTAFAALLLPVTPAHAAWGPDQLVWITVTDNGRALARLEGTIAFDDGNTMYRYSLRLCWQSGSYPAPSAVLQVSGTRTSPVSTGSTSAPGCQMVFLYGATVNFGSLVPNVGISVTSGYFDSSNQYHRVTDSATYDNPFN